MKLREFFYFNKSDRKVLLFMLILAVASLLVLTYVDDKVVSTSKVDEDSTVTAIDRKMDKRHYRPTRKDNGYYYSDNEMVERAQLESFDPNSADSVKLLSLGLPPWIVRNIYKYRAHGGVFRTPEDFARIYGLTAMQYKRLKPYIRISEDFTKSAADLVGPRETFDDSHPRDTLKYPVKLAPTQQIVLNTADTTELKKVPGIGSGWSKAIINYGERLGGYVSVSQLQEIEGFPEDALKYFKVVNPNPRKMNVNKLTLSQLKRHPYINFYQAREICDYRRLKGPLNNLEQLRLLKEFPEDVIERIKPYVEY